MSLLQMSFYGAVLILVVVVIRALAINMLPKKVFLALWGLVLLRLLVPFSVPSVFSVYSLIGRNAAGGYAGQTTVSNVTLMIQGEPSAPAGELSDASAFSVSPWFVIWLVGALLCAAYFAVSYLRCCLEFSTSLPVRNDFTLKWLQDHKLLRHICVRQSDRISTPLTYGIIRPVILMPQTTDWQNTRRLKYIFLHEYVHICHFDTAAKLISACTLCVHWFNPLVWVMYILYNRDIELACDESVVRLCGETSRKEYLIMLLGMEAERSGLLPLYNHFSKNAIEERIKAIMKMKKTTLGIIIGSLALVLVIILLFATSAQKTAYDSSVSGEEIAAYIKEASSDSITVDLTEYITDADTDRIKELGLTGDDLLDGYYFYNADEEATVLKCGEDTVYTFIDWYGMFTGGEYPEEYTTTDAEEFLQYLETYTDAKPGMPFFFTVENGYVKQITEKPFA